MGLEDEEGPAGTGRKRAGLARGWGWAGAGEAARVTRWPVSRGLPGVPRSLTLLLPAQRLVLGAEDAKSLDVSLVLYTQTPAPSPDLTRAPTSDLCLLGFLLEGTASGKGQGQDSDH